jgi:hypothetical protein
MRRILLLLFISIGFTSFAEEKGSKTITVYKNPECGCCNKWIDYLKKNKYTVIEKNTRQLLSLKKKMGIPEKLAACHTAVIDGYIVEGHITHRDIKKLLLFRPDVKGIAVPGMPFGTPGMERGNTRQNYNVISFDKEGNTEVFSEYKFKDAEAGSTHKH